MKALIALYDGELKHDRWHPPVLEALRVLPLALRQQCERIRIERLGGALISEFSVKDLIAYATARRYSITPERITVPGVDWEYHRPIWAVGHSDRTPNKENTDVTG